MSEQERYGLLAEFGDAEQLLEAARRARHQGGYTRVEAYSPFAIEGLDEVLGTMRNRVPMAVLLGGVCGGVATFAMEWYSAVIDYPFNIGGRPADSWQAFMLPAIEMTLLFAALFGVVGMLLGNRLPRLNHPLFDVKLFERTSDDRFCLVLRADDPRFDLKDTRTFLDSLSPLAIAEVAA